MNIRYFSCLRNSLFVFVVLGGGACSPAKPVNTVTGSLFYEKTATEPEFEIGSFHTLGAATQQSMIPYLGQKDGSLVETPCFEGNRKARQWKTQNSSIIETLEMRKDEVSSAVLEWFKAQLETPPSNAVLSNWSVSIDAENVLIRHAKNEDVALAEDQQCFTEKIRALPNGSKVVTTLFGATKFNITSRAPLDFQEVKQLRNGIRKAGAKLHSLPSYNRAKDKKGRPIFKKGKPMFEAPNGILVFKKDVPRPKDRPVYEMTLKIPKGLFVAFGDMPAFHIEEEKGPAVCKINLIFDDMVPRIPNCPEIKDIGFGVSMADEEGSVIVKAATEGETGQSVIPYGTVGLVQAGGTGVAWVTPKRLEEGAFLQIDAWVLHPSDKKSENLMKFKYKK